MAVTRQRSAVVVGLMLLAGCASPAGTDGPPSTSASVEASATADATASASEQPSVASIVPSPTQASSQSPSAALINVDGLARTIVDRLRVREDPGLSGTPIGSLAEGAPSYVVAGPVSADGLDWYQLIGLGIPQASGCMTPIHTDPFDCPQWFGWAAAASPNGDTWLVAAEPDCPDWPTAALTSDFVYGVQPMTYLACFGGLERTAIGFYPELEDGIGGNCPGVPADLAWIACVRSERLVLDPDEGSSSPGLVLAVDAAGGVEMPERGQWIEVTGRYDHPAAQGCTWEGATEGNVLYCRAAFVVNSARPASSP